MKTLLDQFLDDKTEMEKSLRKAKTIEQANAIIVEEFARLENTKSEYFEDKNKPEVRIALAWLNASRASFSALVPIKSEIAPEKSRIDRVEKHESSGLIGSILEGGKKGLEIVLGPDSKTVTCDNSKIHRIKVKDGSETSMNIERSGVLGKVDTESSQIPFDVEEILVSMKNSVALVEEVVARIGKTTRLENAMPNPRIEDFPELLALLQKILGLSCKDHGYLPDMLQAYSDELRSILRGYDIRILTYRPDMPELQQRMFDIEPSMNQDVHDCITLTPALIKGDLAILRGRVVKPNALD
ncbi:MAG: hypothetical protein PHQ34_13900 [Methanothrix sp.]|nr:hypothetical protein [Methanothrix sp.]